jgi:hypothetical protein
METFSSIINLGAAGAVIFVVCKFLKYLSDSQKAERAERIETAESNRTSRGTNQKALTDFMANDIRHLTQVLERIQTVLEELVQELRRRKD